MKRCVLVVILLIFVAILGLALVSRIELQSQANTSVSYSLINDLGEYYRDEQRLPPNWDAFIEGYARSHPPRWNSQDLSKLFVLKWNAIVKDGDGELIRVIDPKLKRHEASLDRMLAIKTRQYSKECEASRESQ